MQNAGHKKQLDQKFAHLADQQSQHIATTVACIKERLPEGAKKAEDLQKQCEFLQEAICMHKEDTALKVQALVLENTESREKLRQEVRDLHSKSLTACSLARDEIC